MFATKHLEKESLKKIQAWMGFEDTAIVSHVLNLSPFRSHIWWFVYSSSTGTFQIHKMVEHRTSNPRVTGLNLNQAWIFFKLSFTTALSYINNYKGFLLYKLFICSSHIWYFISIPKRKHPGISRTPNSGSSKLEKNITPGRLKFQWGSDSTQTSLVSKH